MRWLEREWVDLYRTGRMKGLCALVVCGGLVAVEGVERSDAGVLRGTEEAVKQIAQGRRQLQAGGGLRPMGTRAAKIGCYENFGWAETTDPEQVVPPEPAFLFGSTDGCVRHTRPCHSRHALSAHSLPHHVCRPAGSIDLPGYHLARASRRPQRIRSCTSACAAASDWTTTTSASTTA